MKYYWISKASLQASEEIIEDEINRGRCSESHVKMFLASDIIKDREETIRKIKEKINKYLRSYMALNEGRELVNDYYKKGKSSGYEHALKTINEMNYNDLEEN